MAGFAGTPVAVAGAVVALLMPGPMGRAAPLRESFDLRVPFAPRPVTVDGTARLVYELRLTNFADETLVLRGVTVRDAEARRELASYRGTVLDGRLARIGKTGDAGPTSTIETGATRLLYVEVSSPSAAAPRALRHRVEFTTTGPGDATVDVVDGGDVAVRRPGALTIGPPVRGGPWAAIHDPAWPRGHRRVVYTVDGRARIPGRFAIDWVRVDDEGRTARGDSDVVTNALGYGVDVIAVADAVVAATRDDVAESASVAGRRKHPLGDASGNFVALDLGAGQFAFYEHLRPGSVRVRPGQRVRRGETLGALGFTGDSTGPHLHFHVADASTPLGGEGLPFAFDRFEVLGAYPDVATLGRARWTPPAPGRNVRRGEAPSSNAVVLF